METIIKGIDGIEEAAEVIKRGGLVAFPTETVYGLGGNALDPEAAKRIYAAKGRPSDNPLIVHVSSAEEAEPLVSVLPETARRLMSRFWPGPLTLVLPKSERVPYETTGGLDTVALRCPENKCTLEFIRACGLPIAGPSANTSGKPSPTEARHVYEDLQGRIEMILDDGEASIGVESTILDLSGETPTLLRPGAVTAAELESALGRRVVIDPAVLSGSVGEGVHPKAPGMKYRHYAPKAKMTLVTTAFLREKDFRVAESERVREDERIADFINEETEISVKAGNRVGILCCRETEELYRTGYGNIKVDIKLLGSREDPLSMTHTLFRLLREFDADAVDEIFAESYPERGVGFALMNRLRKASGMREELLTEEE